MILKLIEDIKKSLENECYMAALALALTLPDICGKAEYPTMGNRQRYIGWYDEHIGKYEKPPSPISDNMAYESGEVVYSLRCNLLHQGNPNIEASRIDEDRCKVDRFVLTVDNPLISGTSAVFSTVNNIVLFREMEVNIPCLCKKLCSTAKSYYENNKEKFNFFNYKLVDRRSPDGGDVYQSTI